MEVAEAPIAAVYFADTNTWRVKRALTGLFEGAVGKVAPSVRRSASAGTGRRYCFPT
jgi:hypothetical protein